MVCFFRELSESSLPVIGVEESDGRGRPFSSACASSRSSPCGHGTQRDGAGEEPACRSAIEMCAARSRRKRCLVPLPRYGARCHSSS